MVYGYIYEIVNLGIFFIFVGIVLLYKKKINLILGTLFILLGIFALTFALKSYVLSFG
jgi:hypothetical protein